MSEIMESSFSKEIAALSAKDLELAQVIYKKITEKTEKTIQRYSEKYIIDLDSIKQVYNKLEQITNSWTTIGPNCEVSVTYSDDTTDTFSSAERFFMMDTSKASPILEIAFKYSFLHQTVISENEKPFQPYSVTIRILNANAVYEKEDITPSMFKRFVGASLIVEFEYVDYMIVKSLISTVDSWVEGLDLIKNPKILNFFKKKYNYGGKFFAFIFFTISCLLILLRPLQLNFSNLKNCFIIILLIIAGCTFIGNIMGSKIEELIDSLMNNTRIVITNGDKKLLKKFEDRNKKSVFWLIFNFIISVGYNVLIGLLCSFLDKIIK